MKKRNRLLGRTVIACALIITSAWIVKATTDLTLKVPTSDLKFSHNFHVAEQEIDCTSCHIDIEGSQLSSDSNFPTMDECGACHDVEDDESCGMCHANPDEPMELVNPEREIIFSHKRHIEQGVACEMCHSGIAESSTLSPADLPRMSDCLSCHDGKKAANDCSTCHSSQIELADIHPPDWRHRHGAQAAADRQFCMGCHGSQASCIDCHRGDNLTGNIHDLNFRFTHGLDAKSKQADCAQCHETRRFCNDCHAGELRMPLRHSLISWISEHGSAAKTDVENCASCHDSDDPTCARAGCHSDFDGVRGTNPRIHSADADRFSLHGPWHSDGGYFCYQCHTATNTPGVGFCGYCHGG